MLNVKDYRILGQQSCVYTVNAQVSHIFILPKIDVYFESSKSCNNTTCGRAIGRKLIQYYDCIVDWGYSNKTMCDIYTWVPVWWDMDTYTLVLHVTCMYYLWCTSPTFEKAYTHEMKIKVVIVMY